MSDSHNFDHNHEHDHEYITIVDEEGNELLYEILFTFESQDFNKNYVLIYPAGSSEDDEDIELEAFSYEEGPDGMTGALHPIETDEEWDMVEEVLNTFLNEEE